MVNFTSKDFKYYNRGNAWIVFKSMDDLKYAFQNEAAINIAKNTHNTWQKSRKYDEILNDTVQGKVVEEIFEVFISTKSQYITYVSYDDFRADKYTKHAPIDGLLYKKNNAFVSAGITRIREDVDSNYFGKITTSTFEWLRSHKIYTVEIKSSRIPDKDYPNLKLGDFHSGKIQNNIIANLRKRDFFVYPKYTRSSGKTIHNFDDYVSYVIDNHSAFRELSISSARDIILEEEKKDKCDIYTRIFVDKEHTKNLIIYILGYTIRDNFFINPRIINMPRDGKSENALYYAYPIAESNQIEDLFTDIRLWGE